LQPYASITEDQLKVAMPQGIRAVGDRECGAARRQPFYHCDQIQFRSGVERARGFVQDHDRGIA
jgi:hypothetical protein